MAAAYLRTFEHAGLDVMGAEDTVATRIHDSDVQPDLVIALDHWAFGADVLGDDRLRARLLHVAQSADPESEWGNRLREPALWRNPGAAALPRDRGARAAGQRVAWDATAGSAFGAPARGSRARE